MLITVYPIRRPPSLVADHINSHRGPSLPTPWVDDVTELTADVPVGIALHFQARHGPSSIRDVVLQASLCIARVPEKVRAVIHLAIPVIVVGPV